MRKEKKTYIISSDSYEKKRKSMVNHQNPMRKDKKINGKPSDSYRKR